MNLKEKLCEPFGGLKTETVNELEQIADEFAIEFANWTHNLRNECEKDSAEYNKWKNISNKELLEIYKKEKGL